MENHLLYAVNLPQLPEMAFQNRQAEVEEEESGTNTGVREQDTSGAAESFSLPSFLKPCQRQAAQLERMALLFH